LSLRGSPAAARCQSCHTWSIDVGGAHIMARIRHIALVVKDLEKTADFYQKALGLSRSEMSEGPTARRIYT
jgi:catechol-2,3-dioxygenase